MPGLAIGDWVTLHARYQPRAECMVRPDGSSLTYAEADRQVTRLAWALRAAGLGPATGSGCWPPTRRSTCACCWHR